MRIMRKLLQYNINHRVLSTNEMLPHKFAPTVPDCPVGMWDFASRESGLLYRILNKHRHSDPVETALGRGRGWFLL